MKNFSKTIILLAMASIVWGTVVLAAAEETAQVFKPLPTEKASRLKTLTNPAPVIPTAEPASRVATTPNSGFSIASAFTSATSTTVSPNTALTPPVIITYSGSSDALTVTDSGTGRGETLSLSNTSNINSAFYGETYGSGAGLTGYNKGTVGPGGKFAIVNAQSQQSALFATTNGIGSAITATVTKQDGESEYPAITAQSMSPYGRGVIGQGNIGVEGIATGSAGIGVDGIDDAPKGNPGVGVGASSGYGVGLSAYSGYGTALYAEAPDPAIAGQFKGNVQVQGIVAVTGTLTADRPNGSAGANGAFIHNPNGYGILVESDNSTALVARSNNARGIDGEDFGNGIGVYGSSAGYAGYFVGNVVATGTLTATNIAPSSDRNLKTAIKPIDGRDILERVTNLPISSWEFKSAQDKRHVGPMAQDFHAAFGFNGNDDTHISVTDSAGVSLAAIQELSKQMKLKDAQMREKDVQIAELRAQLATQAASQTKALAELTERFSARMTMLEQRDRNAQMQTLTMASTVRP